MYILAGTVLIVYLVHVFGSDQEVGFCKVLIGQEKGRCRKGVINGQFEIGRETLH